jgi:hypothetical protein
MNDNERILRDKPMKRCDALRVLRTMINFRESQLAGKISSAKSMYVISEIRAMEKAIDSLHNDRLEEAAQYPGNLPLVQAAARDKTPKKWA